MIKKFGLEKANADAYIRARDSYNSRPVKKRDPRLLFTILLYGFQQQIRFNSRRNLDNPVGMRSFNDRVLEKMIAFPADQKRETLNFTVRTTKHFTHG
ncbi:MAG: hypothetical protein V8R75_04600 [Oscillospiraceae bacterium]